MNEQMLSRIEQVRTELLAGTSTPKIANRFAEEWNVSTRTVKRVIHDAQEELDDERRIEREAREKVLEKYASQLAKQEMKDRLEINATLMEIIKGRARARKIFYTPHGLEEKEIEPDFKERIRASEVYNKHAGVRANEKYKETENVNEHITGFRIVDDDEPDELFNGSEEEGNTHKRVAYSENENKVQNGVEEVLHPSTTVLPQQSIARHLEDKMEERMEKEMEEGTTVSPQRGEAQHLGDTAEEPIEKVNLGNTAEEQMEKENMKEPTKETKRNTHPPQTSTFNKWAMPFMPKQHYRNQQRVRVRNYPVK